MTSNRIVFKFLFLLLFCFTSGKLVANSVTELPEELEGKILSDGLVCSSFGAIPSESIIMTREKKARKNENSHQETVENMSGVKEVLFNDIATILVVNGITQPEICTNMRRASVQQFYPNQYRNLMDHIASSTEGTVFYADGRTPNKPQVTALTVFGTIGFVLVGNKVVNKGLGTTGLGTAGLGAICAGASAVTGSLSAYYTQFFNNAYNGFYGIGCKLWPQGK